MQVSTSNDNFFVFPNPAHRTFMLKATDIISRAEIYDMQGRLVFSRITDGKRGDMFIEMCDVSGGVFYVRVTLHNNHVVGRKIMIE
jgi:hypothetical protein